MSCKNAPKADNFGDPTLLQLAMMLFCCLTQFDIANFSKANEKEVGQSIIVESIYFNFDVI